MGGGVGRTVGGVGRPEFVVARNPDPESSLPYLIRLPLGRYGVVLKAKETWPRTSKVFCHAGTSWPDDAEVLERVPVRLCARRGPAIDLVLDRHRENRSQIVFTRIRGGREAIFWQTARTAKQARPNVGLPTAQSAAGELAVLVDSHEQQPWRFSDQRATTSKRSLPAGDYGVEADGTLVASVERKSLADLVSTLTTGKLTYVLADLAGLFRAAVVVEDRWSSVFKLDRVRPTVVAEGLAEAQVRFPAVPIVFCETRPLAQEWTYRFLGAALAEYEGLKPAELFAGQLNAAPNLAPAPPTPAEIRAWAAANGFTVSPKGKIPAAVREAYTAAH